MPTSYQVQNPDTIPDAAAVERISQAAPAEAAARPRAPRKLLVFTLANGWVHSSIETGVKALEILGQKTGAWAIEAANDPAAFEWDNLCRYDAVCFLNTSGDIFRPGNYEELPEEAQQEAEAQAEKWYKWLTGFVKGGKGFIGIHGAIDTNYERPEFGEMLGAYFESHPWQWNDAVTVKVEDAGHPLTRHFNGQSLELTEELYQVKEQPYSREKLRVLLGLDLEKTAPKEGMNRPDNDYPVSWVKTYGAGRVFYSALGHNEPIFENPGILRHFLAGIQFALGDLEADVTPLPQK